MCEAGTGPTEDYSLRVSVATLTRVVFPRLEDGMMMLALENKATLVSQGRSFEVAVHAQPFGGAVRILDVERLWEQSGGFNFDSQRAQEEGDFRVYIQPSKWEAVQAFCHEHLLTGEQSALETNPVRELAEEFHDTLGFHLEAAHYSLQLAGMAVEGQPAPSTNLHASGSPTVRVYRIDHVEIQEPALQALMLINSQKHSTSVLREMALEDVRNGGRGRANAVLALPLEEVRSFYLSLPEDQRGNPQTYSGETLAGNVAAVLDGVQVGKYQFSH